MKWLHGIVSMFVLVFVLAGMPVDAADYPHPNKEVFDLFIDEFIAEDATRLERWLPDEGVALERDVLANPQVDLVDVLGSPEITDTQITAVLLLYDSREEAFTRYSLVLGKTQRGWQLEEFFSDQKNRNAARLDPKARGSELPTQTVGNVEIALMQIGRMNVLDARTDWADERANRTTERLVAVLQVRELEGRPLNSYVFGEAYVSLANEAPLRQLREVYSNNRYARDGETGDFKPDLSQARIELFFPSPRRRSQVDLFFRVTDPKIEKTLEFRFSGVLVP